MHVFFWKKRCNDTFTIIFIYIPLCSEMPSLKLKCATKIYHAFVIAVHFFFFKAVVGPLHNRAIGHIKAVHSQKMQDYLWLGVKPLCKFHLAFFHIYLAQHLLCHPRYFTYMGLVSKECTPVWLFVPCLVSRKAKCKARRSACCIYLLRYNNIIIIVYFDVII